MTRNLWPALAAACTLLMGVYATASTIEIQIIDVDVEYDSATGDITDAGTPTDPVSSLFFFNGGGSFGDLQNPPNALSIDLSIPGVPAIPVGGGTVSSAAGGTLELLTPSSILSLNLDSADVTYTPIGGTLDFVFVGTVGSIASQNLPFGLVLGDPVSVTFSTQANTLTDDGVNVLTFAASGTGELEGQFIPEPTSLVLLGLATAAGLVRRRV